MSSTVVFSVLAWNIKLFITSQAFCFSIEKHLPAGRAVPKSSTPRYSELRPTTSAPSSKGRGLDLVCVRCAAVDQVIRFHHDLSELDSTFLGIISQSWRRTGRFLNQANFGMSASAWTRKQCNDVGARLARNQGCRLA